MAYQDDFRNKVLNALKAKNLAVDISQEATQQAIVEEAQNVAKQEARPMSPEEMKQVLQDVSKQLAAESQQFSAQSADFIAFAPQEAGGPGGSYSGGGIANSVMNKDIMIIPTAGTATSINTLSQIDFKIISNPNAYGVIDPNEVKSSLYNWGERITGNTYDTPVLGLGGAWNGVSYTPTSLWGIGGSQGSGIAGSISVRTGFGQIIYFKPASSTIYAGLYNDLGINVDYATRSYTLTGYNAAVPGSFPTAGFAVTFGGIGNSGDLIIHGAISESQVNTIKFLSPLTISNATASDLLTLGLSSATSTVQNFVGGGSAQYTLSTTTSSFAQGDLFYASGTGHVTLTKLAIGANNTYLTSNGTVPSWTSSIAANTVAVNPTGAGSTILYPLLNNLAGSGAAISTDIDFNVDPGNNVLRYASGSFYVGTAVSSPTFTTSGDLSIRPGANSTTGIQLDNLAGQPVLNVDTTNSRVSIGSNVGAPTYTLDVAGDINASTGQSYRINGTLVLNAGGLGTGVTNSSLTSLGTINTGVWAGTFITGLYGGTGFNSYAVGDLLYAATGTSLGKLAAVATGSVLASQGPTTAPAYVATSTLSVGLATTAQNHYVIANTAAGDNYITFVPAVSSGTAGVGLSVTNQASQLTYSPSTQILRASFVSGTALTATTLAGTLVTASQPNITSASSLATVGTITSGTWQGTAVGTTYGGTGSNLGGNTANAFKLVSLGSAATGYAATLVDGANSGYLLAANGNASAPSFVNSTNTTFTFGGTLNITTAAITNGTITGTPTSANDIVNKSYADSISGGLDVHGSARLTTISAIGGSYRQAGTAGTLDGLGDYIISTTPGTLIGSEAGWDSVGIALTNGQRVLVKDGVTGGYASGSGAYQTMASRTTYGGFANSWIANGIYTVASYGGAATSGWLLIRATDTDNQSGVQELTGGTFLFIEEGTTYADHAYVCSNDTTSLGPIGFGSTQIAWTLFAGGNTLIPGQGLVESGNNLALLFNLVQANQISSSSFFSRGFTLGGARAASLGSSSLNTFTVTGVSDSAAATNTFTANTAGFTLAGGQTNASLVIAGVTANNTITGAADGWTHAGGTTSRTLTVTGSDITLTGGGFTLTLGSSSTASFNSQTLAMTASMGNITFAAGASPTNTTQTLVQNGVTQYQLSSQTNTWAAGDMYYMAGSAFTALTRLALGGTGASVLVKDGTAGPAWGRINLASSDFVIGTLPINNGGTNSTATPTNGGAAYGTGTAYAFTAAGTAGSVLMSTGAGAPVWQQITLSNTNSVSGLLALANGGTNANLTAVNGGAVYSSGTALAITAAGTAGSVLMSTGAGAPVWQQITLSNTNSVSGTLGIANGGTNAAAANFTTNGVVIYDGTRLASATGLTMTGGVGLSVNGTTSSTGGFFIAGNSVVTSFAGLYGAVTISNASSVGGTSFFSISGQNLVLNYPGTGLTGGGSTNQVAYYNATRELTGNVGLVYNPTAATGVGLSVNINNTAGTILQVNSAQTMTSGFLMDIDNNGSQRYTIDFKGMATHTVGSGNTGLIVSGGRTILSAATANYSTINLPSSSGTNPGAGITQVGDLWFNGTNLYFRKDSTTNFDLLVGSVSGSGTANKIAKWSTASALTDSNITDAGVGMTITATSAVGVGLGSTAYLTIQSLSGDEAAGIRNNAYLIRGIQSATNSNTRVFSVDVAGNLRATTKSFDIPHPTKDGMRLVYGVLEGPEHGVYHRGTVEGKGVIQVNLPDYWHKLVGDQYTIQLTPWGNYNVSIDSKTENYFTIQLVGDFISRKFKNIKVDYIVHGSRLDAPLDTEQ